MPIDIQNYYTTLGLQIGASIEDIKINYRNLAKIHHPDKGGDAENFKLINKAYECLSNDEKRAQYDRMQMHKGFDKTFDNPSSTSPKDNSFQIQKEDWDVFENLARKILTVINPLKQYIYIGPSETAGMTEILTCSNKSKFEIGSASDTNSSSNLNEEERQNFINIVLLFQHRFMSKEKPSSAMGMPGLTNFNPERDDCMAYGDDLHTRLRYNAKVVKTIALLVKEQDEQVKTLLNEYQIALTYTIYFNNEIAAKLFPAFKISIDTKNETLQFLFSEIDSIDDTLNEDEINQQQRDLKKWIDENYSLPIIEQNSIITYYEIKKNVVQCRDIISKLTADDIRKITEAKIAENEKKVIEHLINNIKDYIEYGEYEKIEKEVKKLQIRNINISKVDELIKKQNKASLLMHAVRHGAPLDVIKYLVDQGSSLDCDRTNSGRETKLFMQAIQSSPLDVITYLYEKLGNPDLNNITMQDIENESVLWTAIISIPEITSQPDMHTGKPIHFNKAQHDHGRKVVTFLIKNGARLSHNDREFTEQHHRNIAQDAEEQIRILPKKYLKIDCLIQQAKQLCTESGDEKKDSHLEPDSLAKIVTDLNQLKNEDKQLLQKNRVTTGHIASALRTSVDNSTNLPQDQENTALTSQPLQSNSTQSSDNDMKIMPPKPQPARNQKKIIYDDSPQDRINIFHFIFGSEPQEIKLDETTGNFTITFKNNQINLKKIVTQAEYQQFCKEIFTEHKNALTELKNYDDYLTKTDQACKSMFFASDSSQSKKTEIAKLREILMEQSASTPGNQAANIIKLRGNLNNSTLATFRDGWILWLLKRVTIIPWLLNASGVSKAEGGKVVDNLQAITAAKKSL